jgi:formylmethanofuran dehydrogenase subunit A
MKLHGAEIVDTFAEAFPMWGARVVITAATPAWALEAGRSMTGFATSVIGCKCEASIERELDPDETPDGRPGVSALLFAMDREFRNEAIRSVNQQAMRRTVLHDDLEREYTLEEIAILTRAGPARLLGLRDKGHLGAGADADITVYDDRADREAMFAAPRYVIKDGRAVVEDHELRETPPGRLLRAGVEYDPAIEPTLEEQFAERYSVQFASYPVREPWLLEPARTVPAEPR